VLLGLTAMTQEPFFQGTVCDASEVSLQEGAAACSSSSTVAMIMLLHAGGDGQAAQAQLSQSTIVKSHNREAEQAGHAQHSGCCGALDINQQVSGSQCHCSL
jgi:hypothetical protein